MNQSEALVALAEGTQQIRNMSRSKEDGDPFRRWRVRTSTTLTILLGADDPEVQTFYQIVYWPQHADATDEEHEQAWEQGKETVLSLLKAVSNKIGLQKTNDVQDLPQVHENS